MFNSAALPDFTPQVACHRLTWAIPHLIIISKHKDLCSVGVFFRLEVKKLRVTNFSKRDVILFNVL